MFILEGVVLPDEIFKLRFSCKYHLCKGMCCVVGDSGAPLRQREAEQLHTLIPTLLAQLPDTVQDRISRLGPVEQGRHGWSTPCLDDSGACIYTVYEENVAVCSLQNFTDPDTGVTLRPISCRLFPLRIHSYNGLIYLDYEIWEECETAWGSGDRLIEFCRPALIDRFGDSWYSRLMKLSQNSTPGV